MPDIDINVDEALIKKLRKLFKLEKANLKLIRQAGERVLPSAEQLLDGLFSHILSFPEIAAAFRDEQSQQRMRVQERTHLAKLLSGSIDEEFVRMGFQVGSAHEALSIEPSWLLACYAYNAEYILQRTFNEKQDIPKEQLLALCQALAKIILLDISLAWEAYYRQKEQRIKDAYKTLEVDHNLALGMIKQRDKEIEELLKTRGKHPGSGPSS